MSEPGFTCPRCGAKFNPFAGAEPLSKTGRVTCPQCGYQTPVQEDPNIVRGPVSRPETTRIERNRRSDTELGFSIPPKGLRFSNVLFAVIWNGVVIAAGIGIGRSFLSGAPAAAGQGIGLILLVCLIWLLFAYVGLGLVYATLDLAFGRQLLYLSPDRVRFHHDLFHRLKKNRDLVTNRIESVELVETLVRGHQMGTGELCSLVIKSPDAQIAFGRELTQDERRWLCYEIRQFVQDYAPRKGK